VDIPREGYISPFPGKRDCPSCPQEFQVTEKLWRESIMTLEIFGENKQNSFIILCKSEEKIENFVNSGQLVENGLRDMLHSRGKANSL